jgi:chemotaxis protein methyltransferase CheR
MAAEVGSVEFRALRDRIRRRFGLYFDDSKEYLLRSRLQQRLVKCRVESLGEYCAYLDAAASRESEWDELASLLANNESYFFRERAQLDVLAGTVLEQARERATRLRIWSAACAGGEEPYTLAMTLLESGKVRPSECSIVASDLSPRALERAERGFYRELAFRATPPSLIERYFRPFESGFFIDDSVKAMVRFLRVNLLDTKAVTRIGVQDAIFCRNVLIYFERPTQLEVARGFARILRPGGYLFLGHAESLMHARDLFEPVIASDAVYYRRKNDVAAR